MADEYIDKVEVGAKIQMMYIRREMDYGGENDFCRGMRKALRVIENMPAADVQPVKRGKWEKKRGYLVCSNCGMTVDTIGYTYEEQEEVFRYCSCCDYRMDGDVEWHDTK